MCCQREPQKLEVTGSVADTRGVTGPKQAGPDQIRATKQRAEGLESRGPPGEAEAALRAAGRAGGGGGGMPTSPRFPRDAINHPNCSVMWSVDTRIILKCCSDQNTCTHSHTHTNVHTRSHRLINTHMLTHKCTHPQARSTLVHAMVNPPQALHVTRQDSEPWVLF